MQIIPVASGKGGVGKSLLSANLAVALGKAGKKVVLVDLDLGASNLHLVIGHQSPKAGIGTYLGGQSSFQELIVPTDYDNVYFIPGDAEIPGLTAIKLSQKNDLIKKLQTIDADYLILDLGAGTHLTILDFFLLSPQGIIVTAPTVTATLNGYLFLKNAVFRLMYNSFKKNSKAYAFLEDLKKDTKSLQRLYIPKLAESIERIDPTSAAVFKHRMKQFKPRLILNMIDDPKDADKAQKIRRSCSEYLGIDLEHLGVIYKDSMQDIALSSRLPITVYKPQAMISQSVFRIADKILQSETLTFDKDFDSFRNAETEAAEDFESKLSYIEDLLGTGALTMNDLAETIKAQQYEISQLRKENNLYKSKLIKAVQQGFKI
jgi:flagellar biosynthesis protein FlhG